MKKGILLLFMCIFCVGPMAAQEPPCTDTIDVKVYFRQGYSTLDPTFRNNGANLEGFVTHLRAAGQDRLNPSPKIRIVAGSSPEGITRCNTRLAENRARELRSYLGQQNLLEGCSLELVPLGIDWEGLARLVEASDMPYRTEVLELLHGTPEWILRNDEIVDGRKRRLEMLHGGRPWKYMYDHFFPHLRCACIRLVGGSIPQAASEPASVHFMPERSVPGVVPDPEPVPETVSTSAPELACDSVSDSALEPVPVPVSDSTFESISEPIVADKAVEKLERKPYFMALRTNLLYDAVLVPNIGVEFQVGRGWSVGGNWMYAWWKNERRHRYWRTYGGELDIRKYFGRRAAEKPLTGHHLGFYVQGLTYDFETGGTGYQSKFSYGAGIEYGYSLPIGRCLNLDFGIGVGYLGGEYKEYAPADDHYVWKATKQRHWFGPTKAEVSLVWLIGGGVHNQKKGGKR